MDETNKPDQPEEQSPKWFAHQTDNFNSLYFGQIPEHLANSPEYAPALRANLLQLITDPQNKPIRNQVLEVLKKYDSRVLLVQLLEDSAHKKYHKVILTAAWETGMDFSPWLINFARLIPNSDFETCLELTTVLEEMQGPFDNQQRIEALQLLATETDTSKKALLQPVYDRLREYDLGALN
jgi:hypothetical protein